MVIYGAICHTGCPGVETRLSALDLLEEVALWLESQKPVARGVWAGGWPIRNSNSGGAFVEDADA